MIKIIFNNNWYVWPTGLCLGIHKIGIGFRNIPLKFQRTNSIKNIIIWILF
jgi:hypothetical protein